MSISFQCPACGKGFTVSADLAGKKARCKQCGGAMVVPSGGPAKPAPPPPPDLYGFDDEPGPLPPRAAPARPAEVPDAPRSRGASGKKKKKGAGSDASNNKATGFFAGVGGTGFVLTMIVLRLVSWGIRANRQEGPAQAPAAFAPFAATVSTQPWTMPALPDRGPMREFKPGVTFQEVRVGPGHPAPGLPPAHGMTLYFYLPPGEHPPGSLPCVLIAPAGSILVTGMELGEGDQREHLPYVRAGFAVLSYSLDGHVPDLKTASDAQIRQASTEFLAAKSGLTNARVALEWLTAKVPEVDTGRIYAAGHSSAGTLALLLAENEPRIKKCAAFAPRSDVEANFPGPQQAALRQAIPGVDAFFTTYNPKHHAGQVGCPVLLFHASDDPVVPAAESESFASTLKGLGKDVTLVTVPSGGHYVPMIGQGIPRAIAWFKGGDAPTAGFQRPAPGDVNSPPVNPPGAPGAEGPASRRRARASVRGDPACRSKRRSGNKNG